MPDPRRNTRGLIALATYLERPRTLGEICSRFRLTERTAYRWLDYLRQDGKDVAMVRRRGRRAYRVLFT